MKSTYKPVGLTSTKMYALMKLKYMYAQLNNYMKCCTVAEVQDCTVYYFVHSKLFYFSFKWMKNVASKSKSISTARATYTSTMPLIT